MKKHFVLYTWSAVFILGILTYGFIMKEINRLKLETEQRSIQIARLERENFPEEDPGLCKGIKNFFDRHQRPRSWHKIDDQYVAIVNHNAAIYVGFWNVAIFVNNKLEQQDDLECFQQIYDQFVMDDILAGKEIE